MYGTDPLKIENSIRNAITSGGGGTRQAREDVVNGNSYSVRSPYFDSSPFSSHHNDVNGRNEIVAMEIEGTDYEPPSQNSRVFGMSVTGSQLCPSFGSAPNEEEAEERFVTMMLTGNL